MSEGALEAIQKALDSKLMGFGTTNSITIALENISAPTSTDTPYLAGYLLPASIQEADLGYSEEWQGIYQIDINHASHIGSAQPNRIFDKLRAAFKVGSNLYRDPVCLVITAVEAGPLLVEGGWAKRPITISWTTHTERL